ncbi:LssY C-terminal domain-containing protein [Cupriavidus numazuensis]|uniref:LssY C-terminal domain-containing protein n=1 Tax=Cupriavidus numazuensis TaxID=221992 RepID=UPI001FD45EC4|nr:LssY C-terminal domain-containing protein [Cupriavidus numazuensis]
MTKQDVSLSAAVLSTADSERMFGVNLNATGVQPVWIEVTNQTSQSLGLLRTGTDPDYFSPLEVAWSVHTWFGGKTNARIDEWFNRQGFHNPIPPGATRSGVVFTNPERGTKLLNVDLLGNLSLVTFTLFLKVPDDAGNPSFARQLFEYPASAVTDYRDLPSLRAALERLPCCATDATGQVSADPLNGVAIGDLEDFGAAMVRRNYRRNQQAFDNAQYVFGRIPDAVLRKQAQAGAPANWIRAWRVPFSYEARTVYVLQIGRPVGGRFAAKDSVPVLHEDVDEARNLVIQDGMYSEGMEKLGFIGGVGHAPRAQVRTALDGAYYFTDGLRAVMFFATRPLSLSDLEILDWVPYVVRYGAPASGEDKDDRE